MSAPHDPWKDVMRGLSALHLEVDASIVLSLRGLVDAARAADAAEIATLRATVDQQQAEAAAAEAFYQLTVAQRDQAWREVEQQQARITELEAALKEAHALMRLFQTCYPAAIASLPENAMERFRQALETP